MPIYTYRCEHCGIQFDRKQKFSDDPLKVCPECGTETLRKVYTPVGIVFKGSGFYATDNRSPSGMDSRSEENSSGEKKDSKSDTTESSKTSKKSDSKTKKDSD
jgi:putative FmdB family regulatory protein